MPTECTASRFEFEPHERRKVVADFRGGTIASNAGMGSLYRSKHEMIAVFKSGRAPHINNLELGRPRTL